MKKITFFTLCLTLFLVGNLYAQETVWVSATGAGLKNGTSQANAYAGFSTAFVQINSAGDILRVVGTVPASAVSLNKNFAYTIQGDTGGSTLTGANAAVRMFTNNTASRDSQNVTFRNIKFTGATNSTGAGGGVLLSNQANTINFENCRFEGNSIAHASTGGGAIFIQTSTVNISDCLFKENQALTVNGGAIQVTSGTVTINRSTFYRNKTASTTATVGGGALYVLGGTVTANYCTFFQNTIGHIAPEYGTIRTAGGVTTVNNSLFYDNKMNATWTAGNPVTTGGALADWGSAGSIGSTLTKSLAQIISANVTNTNSNSTANLASSNLTYDDTSGKVRYQPAASGDATPIGFGDSSTDVGSWNCGTRVTPTFNAVAAICSGATLSALPTTSTNGIIGTWSPALDNTTTTTYTFTPNVGECATSRVTMTITVTPSTTTGSVTVSQNTPYTWAKNSVTYTETTNISIIEDCNTATLNFTLLASTPPTISALTSNGTIAITEGCGGSTLIITGADFSGATEVLVNGFTAIYTVNSSTQITATLPAGPIGPGVVTVTTPAGSGSSAGNFAVNANATPTFDSVAAICAGGTLSALPTTSDNGITGTWSPALNNTATTEYTFTPTAGLCATTATMTITVNACPADTFTWTGTSSNDWATAANWTKTAGTSPDGYPGQTPGRLIDNVVISNGGTPVVASGTYQIYSLAINNATGADSGSILTINSGATLTVNNTSATAGSVAITLKGGSIVNNGTLNANSTNTGASFGIACLVPSVAPSTAKEYGYSGSGALNITTTLGNASSGGIQFNGTSLNTTYKMLFNGTTTFNLNNTALAIYALRVVDGATNPIIIGGAGFTLGTVGAPVNNGLLIMGNNGNNVTVDTGTTLTLNSAATNTAMGINILQTNAASADVNFTNKGTVAILGASSSSGINLSVNNSTNILPAINKINFENQGTVNVDLAIGSSSNNAALRVPAAGTTEGLVTITNTGTGVLNLKNSQPFTSVTGCPIRIFAAVGTPAVTINNAGALSFTGQSVNFGGIATRSAINNTGTIVSSSEFQSFTVTNGTAGTITFNYNTPATTRSVQFTVALTAAATAGATYTDVAGNVYTVVLTKVNGTGTSLIGSFPLTGVPTPVPNKLTKTSGTGDTEISYNTSITTFEASPLSASDSAFINNGTVNTGTATNLNTFAAVTTSATSVIAPGGTGVGNTVIANASTVALNGTLKLDIQSIASSTSYDKITNNASGGGFNITNATLDLTGIFTPVGDRTISILTTNATGTLTGNFASVIGLESNPRWQIKYTTGTAGKVELVYTGPTTWTGTTSTDWTVATNWSNVVPTSNHDVTIAAASKQPVIASNVSVKSLTLNASTSLTVSSGFNLTITGAIANSGTMTIENNANLIQGGTTNTNTGNVIVKRNSNPLYILDYTMWSSPVSGTQTLAQFSPMTSIDPYIRFYTYDPANNWYKFAVPSSTFTTGTGYLIRMPKEGDATYIDGTAPLTHNGQFTGIPNNGTLTLSGLAADKFHSVGNPYPSTISADAFISGNSTGGMLYFWRKRNAQAGSAYATYNLVGGTASGNASTEVPNGTIQVGQGFIVKTAAEATTLAFTNAMRAGTVSTQIFKTKQVQKDRVWVNLTRPATKTGTIDIPEAFSQALIGYMDGATLGVDEGIDGKYINDSKVALTSNINDEEYTIQGRPKFDPADIVALNFKTDADSEYTIALDHFDGVFAAGQDVYLVDSKTGTETDLKAGAYTFNATSGIDNTRFSLKYQKTLKVDAPAFNENSVSVYKNNGALYVNSGFVAMSNIKVFDIQGRLVAEQKNLKSTTAVFNNLRAKNQVLIVKITGENNNVVSKKIVN
jgi:hypothetical protein